MQDKNQFGTIHHIVTDGKSWVNVEGRKKDWRGGEGVLYEMCDDLQLGRYGIS